MLTKIKGNLVARIDKAVNTGYGLNPVGSFLANSVTFDEGSSRRNLVEIVGVILETPVAPGAELIGYSGFSATNALIQPHNPDLDFGTGDFYIMGWVKCNPISSYDYILDRAEVGGVNSDSSFFVVMTATGEINITLPGANPTLSTSTIDDSQWRFFTVGRWGGFARVYVNGILEGSDPNTTDLNNSDKHVLWIGNQESDTSRGLDGDLALLRIGAGAPTDEQIKEIYEDEKFLFQDNAKCTLNGLSDAVVALAYDDTTELLHVGTSGGRSVFQGLRRVDKTSITTTEIAAEGGLIVEETA